MRLDLGPEADIVEGRPKCVTADGKAFALFRVAGSVYCLDNHCPHVGGPLCRGPVQGPQVTCPLHGSRFDVRTGELVRGPAQRPAQAYPVAVDGGRVFIELP